MTVLFDLDGTLVDTEKLAISVTDTYFKRHDILVNPKDLEILVGHTWKASVQFLLARYALEKANILVEQELLKDYRAGLAQNVPTIPGSIQAVLSLSQEFRLAVVSGSHRADIELILKSLNIRPCFELIVGFEDYKESKPAPEPYLTALKRLGSDAKNTLVFEDSTAGIQAAQAAGLSVVKVGKPLHGNDSRPATPWIIDDLSLVNVQWVRNRLL